MNFIRVDHREIDPEYDPSVSHPTFSVAVQEIDLFREFERVRLLLVPVLPKSTWAGEISSAPAVAPAPLPLPLPPSPVIESTSTGDEELQAATRAAQRTALAA